MSVDLAHHEIVCAKVGKVGIKRLAQGHNTASDSCESRTNFF